MARTVDGTETLGDKVKRGARRTMRTLLVIILVAFVGIMLFLYYGVYDEGVRAGVVLKVSNKGAVFKTWEGQLNLQTFGSLKGAETMAESFDFSVEKSDQQVVDDLKAVSLSGERVNLHYIKRYAVLPWRGETKYFVQRVERLAGAGQEQDQRFPR